MTVTALCTGPTATGFERAAAMGSGSTMFRKAASAAEVATAGVKALDRGNVLCYPGATPKWMSVGEHLLPRSVTRKFARRMDR